MCLRTEPIPSLIRAAGMKNYIHSRNPSMMRRLSKALSVSTRSSSILQTVSKNGVCFRVTNLENQSSLKEENCKIEERIGIISRKCELEYKLFKNEIECYTKIEARNNKDRAADAFNVLQKKYEKFKNCLIEAIDTIKELKDVMSEKIDDLRYTFIDDIKEFYTHEISKLHQITPKPLNIPSNPKSSSNLVQSLSIIKEENKKSEDKVKMEYNVGDISINSEDYLDPSPQNPHQFSESKNLSQSLKETPKKIVDFNTSNIEEISSTNFNDSVLELTMSQPRKRGTSMEDLSSTFKITNVSKQRSKF